MADAAVGFLLENLKQLLLYNAELIGNAEDQLERLQEDLILLNAFLRDCAEKRSNNHIVQALENKIRSVVHKAEDVIDKLFVEMTKFQARNILRKAIGGLDHTVTIRNVAKEVESIRKDVMEIYPTIEFGLQELPLKGLQDRDAVEEKDMDLEELPDRGANEKKASDQERKEGKPSFSEENNVVGFGEEVKTVIKRLTREDEDLDIITIIGMAGLGKTTLAREIYTHPTIENKFSTRAWVYVSQNYQRREVFLSILKNFPQKIDYSNKSDEDIAEELRKSLEKEKYLIVMDNVHTREAWNDLKYVFPNNKKGSRILVTSRHNQVARHATPTKGPHKLKFLTRDESWELLERKVFRKHKCPTGKLQMLEVHIATKCEGLPLAILVIAGILFNNRKLSRWWKQVAQEINSFVVTKQIMDVIALSYDHLPYNLKLCFLYLGVFPEGYEIPVWKLTCLWIAEGFIEENEGLSLEDIAEAYVKDLINRNLLMVVQKRSNGQIKTCCVHDMLYNFCKKEAEKQNFYQEIKRLDQVTLQKYRRVCIQSNVIEYASSKLLNEPVRTFMCFGPDRITSPLKFIFTILKSFELIKVLDIRSIIFKIFPEDLLQLVLLRYISISCNVKALPSSICNLWNIQTLIFITTSRTLELKEDMWKIYQLRHLRTNASAFLPRPPSNTSKGRGNVQSLSMISPESCTEYVFARTPNIKKLGVRGNLVVLFDNLFQNVVQLQWLTNLKLFHDVSSLFASDQGKILTLPPAYKFPTKLKKLTLSGTSLDWEHMHILGSLAKLEVLKLKDNAFKGNLWEPKDGVFLSLKVLHIGRTNLVTWKASKDHFPCLKCLVLRHCEELEKVPLGLADVTSFQELALFDTPKAAASAKDIQQKKMTKEGQDTKASGGFKLSIYPPNI